MEESAENTDALLPNVMKNLVVRKGKTILTNGSLAIPVIARLLYDLGGYENVGKIQL